MASLAEKRIDDVETDSSLPETPAAQPGAGAANELAQVNDGQADASVTTTDAVAELTVEDLEEDELLEDADGDDVAGDLDGSEEETVDLSAPPVAGRAPLAVEDLDPVEDEAEDRFGVDPLISDEELGADLALDDIEITDGDEVVAEDGAESGFYTADLSEEDAPEAEVVEPEPVAAVAAPVAEPEPVEAPKRRVVDQEEGVRILEALLFASTEPLDMSALNKRMPDGINIKLALETLQSDYALRGVNLVKVAGKWTFRTAYDLAWLMTRESTETRKLSRAAVEMLAIVAYHQPVTRAEIEDIRGVVTSKGTLDVLLETGWIKPRGRRKTPGRPLTFGTTDEFLSQFSLESLGDLPGLEELKGTGLLDSRLPAGFSVPNPSDDPMLREDEDPLEVEDLQLALAPKVDPEPDEPDAAEGGDVA